MKIVTRAQGKAWKSTWYRCNQANPIGVSADGWVREIALDQRRMSLCRSLYPNGAIYYWEHYYNIWNELQRAP